MNVRDGNFLWINDKEYPPFNGEGVFRMISVWFVVRVKRAGEREHNELWVRNRVIGLNQQEFWETMAGHKEKMERDISDEIERLNEKRYEDIDFLEFAGWTAHLDPHWYALHKKEVRLKRRSLRRKRR